MALRNTSRNTISARERRVVVGGVAIVVASVLLAYVIVPFARRWQAREASIDAARARVAYLTELTSRTTSLERAAADAERAMAEQPRRALHARSAALAASALQSMLQEAADASHVAVTRLDVAPDSAATADAPLSVPATMSVYGDIVGAATLLDILSTGPRIVAVDKLVMQRNAALLGAADVVQLTLTLRAPVLPP